MQAALDTGLPFDTYTLRHVFDALSRLKIHTPGRGEGSIPFWRADGLHHLVPCMFVNRAWKESVYEIRKIVRVGNKIYNDVHITDELIKELGKEEAMRVMKTDPRWDIDNLKEQTELFDMTSVAGGIPYGCSFQYLQWWLEAFPNTKLPWSTIFDVGGLEVYKWVVEKNAFSTSHRDISSKLFYVVFNNRVDVLEDDTFLREFTHGVSSEDYGLYIDRALKCGFDAMAEKILDLYMNQSPRRHRTPKMLADSISIIYKVPYSAIQWLKKRHEVYLQVIRDKRKVANKELARVCKKKL